jgi:Spy/CpxP family protein refolding chaperone
MKLRSLTFSTVGLLALGGFAFAQGPVNAGQDQRGGRGFHQSMLQRTTDQLNLTPDQKAKVQPIIDQANPQIENIRREAMQKTRAVMENAFAQIRPLLTPEQQKKLDESQNNRGRRRGGHGRHDQSEQSDQADQ